MLNVSLLRKTAIATGLVGVVTGAQAIGGFLGFVDSSYQGAVGGHYWIGHIDLTGTTAYFDTNGVGFAGFFKWSQAYGAGQYDARGHGGGDKSLNEFYSICGQFEGIDPNQNFNAYDSSDGVNPGLDGVERGGAVAGMSFMDALSVTGSQGELAAAGFQIAVWAAVYGGGGAMSISGTGLVSVAASSFTAFNSSTAFYDASAGVDSVAEYAKYYYDLARGDGWAKHSIFLDSINEQGNQTGQDQYTVAVPEPFTMSIGLAGIAAYIRRRAKGRK